jgi:hypothetical protein
VLLVVLAERVGFEPHESAVDKTCAGFAVAGD